MTFDELINEWTASRVAVGDVMEYTAKKDAYWARMLEGLLSRECDEIRKIDVIKEIGAMRKTRSSNSVRSAIKRGKSAFKWGRLMDLTTNAPFDNVPMPKVDPTKRNALSPEDAKRLRAELDADESDISLMAKVALMTGMRYGEVLALRGSDIDGCTITVNRSVKCDLKIGEPKTRSSKRRIAIPQSLADELKARGEGPLFTMSYNRGEHQWAMWRESHGFHGLKFHELRHTHATLLIGDGVDVKTVQHRLGHSSATITMDVYAHAIPSLDVEAADKIERMVANG